MAERPQATEMLAHCIVINELKAHTTLGRLLCGIIPANEAVSYTHNTHQSVFTYAPKAPASRAYAQLVGSMGRHMAKGGA